MSAPKAKTPKNPKSPKAFGQKNWTPEQLLGLHRQMLLVRRFEEKAGQLYGLGLIGGFCHLYIGQEAVVIGAQNARNKNDTLTTTYRAHGHSLAVGSKPELVMAELLGRHNGVSKGKGGSMHLFDTKNQFYGGHGIVGAPVPLAAGLAFAMKYKNKNAVSIVFFGDGALNQGQVYETFNMAALWNLPILFVIENNKYGMGTSIERSSAHPEELHNRGNAYGINGEKIDGMDIIAVHDAVAKARRQILKNKTPFILEAMTYRYRGHSMSDPAKYRSRSEVEEVRRQRDPIERFAQRLADAGIADEKILKNIDAEVKTEVNAATENAKNSPEPAPAELWTDIYNTNNQHNLIRVGENGAFAVPVNSADSP
ncbi:MAG: pyruvate dehydrogenase (acetyl-transferring) E1 component subunit alpha [Alphaproteobacteria bacterium]|nr:pyruvate dehydrogenase (acetyl-transferring) E1 component subunit alpha [Alphaproteobacteria bacterium]